MDFNGWHVDGDWTEWEYTIKDEYENLIATISKDIWNFTDVYWIDIVDDDDAFDVLMVVIAIDAEKCSRS